MAMRHQSIEAAVRRALNPGRFFVAPPARLRVEHTADHTLAWEVFRGHLIEPAHTRQSIVADLWNLFLDEESLSLAPLVSVIHETNAKRAYVTRQILVYGAEAYEESPGVIFTRDVQKWVRELVATIDVGEVAADALAEKLEQGLLLAVVGISRLPITSLESPLPAYSLGQLGYCPILPDGDDPFTDSIAFLAAALTIEPWHAAQVKALETCLRSIDADATRDVARVLAAAAERGADPALRFATLFHSLFRQVALSPHTQFTARLSAVLAELARARVVFDEPVADALSYMLRHLCRHLTAFDLTLFHNFGANYPDALFLDELLKTYFQRIAEHPSLVLVREGDSSAESRAKLLRRRALRQAALVRRHYEGQPVPDAPTSMGENLRVLPAAFARVPEAQITQPRARRKLLFEHEPTEGLLTVATREVLDQSVADLADDAELCELGIAVFLARPFGVFKEQGEVDRTPLVAFEAFSRTVASTRLNELLAAGWLDPVEHAQFDRATRHDSAEWHIGRVARPCGADWRRLVDRRGESRARLCASSLDGRFAGPAIRPVRSGAARNRRAADSSLVELARAETIGPRPFERGRGRQIAITRRPGALPTGTRIYPRTSPVRAHARRQRMATTAECLARA